MPACTGSCQWLLAEVLWLLVLRVFAELASVVAIFLYVFVFLCVYFWYFCEWLSFLVQWVWKVIYKAICCVSTSTLYCACQLSLLPLAGWEMSTGQSAIMLCGWGVKAGWFISYVDKRVSSRWKLCDSSLTCPNLSTLEMSIAHVMKHYTNVLRTYCFLYSLITRWCFQLIVAVNAEQVSRLDNLHDRGIKNEVPDLKVVGADEIRDIEPNCVVHNDALVHIVSCWQLNCSL